MGRRRAGWKFCAQRHDDEGTSLLLTAHLEFGLVLVRIEIQFTLFYYVFSPPHSLLSPSACSLLLVFANGSERSPLCPEWPRVLLMCRGSEHATLSPVGIRAAQYRKPGSETGKTAGVTGYPFTSLVGVQASRLHICISQSEVCPLSTPTLRTSSRQEGSPKYSVATFRRQTPHRACFPADYIEVLWR